MQGLLDSIEGQVMVLGAGVAVLALIIVGIIMMFTGPRKAIEKLAGVIGGILIVGASGAIVSTILAVSKAL